MGEGLMGEGKFVWGGEVGRNVTTSLPFLVKLDVLNEHDEPMSDYAEVITISAVTTTICLREGFEDRQLGLWCALRCDPAPARPPAFTARGPPSRRTPAFLPGHYEHGFDVEVCAPGSSGSLYLKGGNDSNFGMTLKLPTPSSNPSADADAAVTPAAAAATAASASASEGESSEDAQFDGNFRPQSVSFYVRTDNERADAGHFILGESNEVNKRVAQFQFTKDGKMGLLGKLTRSTRTRTRTRTPTLAGTRSRTRTRARARTRTPTLTPTLTLIPTTAPTLTRSMAPRRARRLLGPPPPP